MGEDRQTRVADWVKREVLPCEHLVRAWLARSLVSHADSDDLIQEAYCRLAKIDDFESIERPDAFFFQTVRNLLLNQIRHARIIRIETAAELDDLGLADEAPSPERIVGARRDLARVRERIDALPERCRRIFEMRRIEGLSQREIAARMGVSENIVEHDTAKAIKLVLKALRRSSDVAAAEPYLRTRLR
ncbi:RNA polymerase sigma factor [Sphingosinicella rhizophila]|uniref:Sigma-70 family RNA polymerase sigma factor n=1 Tax=Sphingosinicella rhizophila TaxID=3050082 RepID=A0ABU3QAK8_9SPHN|nr:sigma-70 family RNA polymerase sigma factor [Sphingosinicella sp. GR2756]MDT9600169.1 sigma-70 family RNA polymerase sigma factor [Sphingosinicella sp. GR2756]